MDHPIPKPQRDPDPTRLRWLLHDRPSIEIVWGVSAAFLEPSDRDDIDTVVEILGRASAVLAEEAACDGDPVVVDEELAAFGRLIGERLRRLNRAGTALRGDRVVQVVRLEVLRSA